MSLGEWISVQSSRELAERQIRIEREELEANPEEEREELEQIYESRGLAPAVAKDLSQRLIADPAQALEVLVREELGIDPKELGGSPWVAAGSSLLLFSFGALVPVVPFLFVSGKEAIVASLVCGGVALFLIGAAISVVTGRSPLFSGARQMAFGLGAAGITFGVGKLVGVLLG
jgi:VIT1/CCC1 family predicted Fe2+/Mn2+ transporter